MKKKSFRFPASIIAKRLIWKIALYAFLLIVLSTAITAFVTWSYEKNQIGKTFDDIKKSKLDVIRMALWVDDKENLQVILMGISRLPGIEYAHIHYKNDISVEAGRKNANSKLSMIVPIIHIYDGNEYKLGSLHVEGNAGYIYKKVINEILAIGLSQSSMIIIVCILMAFSTYRIVIRRLLRITAYTGSLSADSLDTPLVMDRENQQPDELNQLTDAINHMREDLHRAFNRQKVLEEQLREHHKNLEKTVEQRTSKLNATNKELQLEISERKRIETEREKLIRDLQRALNEVKKLSGMLPICSYCKKIRDDKGYWNQIESYINERSDAEFSHSICPECAKKHFPDLQLYDK